MGSMSDMTSVLHDMISVLHQSVAINSKGGDCLLRLVVIVNSNLVQYLLQTDIQKRTEKIQWQIQTLHRDFSPGNPNRENQHILYSYIVLHCLQYNIHIGASGIQNPNPMTWISPKP
jgi:hypothetical protein